MTDRRALARAMPLDDVEPMAAMDRTDILIVEDESLIAFDLADMLEDLGYDHVQLANSYEAAERALNERSFDVAFFDLNLAGRLSTPLIVRACEMGIYVVVTSGYEARTVPTAVDRAIPRLMKPYDSRMVEGVLQDRRPSSGRGAPG